MEIFGQILKNLSFIQDSEVGGHIWRFDLKAAEARRISFLIFFSIVLIIKQDL